MNASYDESRRLFRIDTARATYAFAVSPEGKLCHLHFGGRLGSNADLDGELRALASMPAACGVNAPFPYRQEYAVQEPFDYGQDALFPVFEDGRRGVRLSYARHELDKDALRVFLRDEQEALEAELTYRGFGNLDLIARSVTVRSLCDAPISLERMLSATVYLPDGATRLTSFSGSWGAEYTKRQRTLGAERIVLENHRGNCAAHQHVPFAALDDGSATETDGEVFFGALQWSGDMMIVAERDFFGEIRLSAGVNDYDARWTLTKERPFVSPTFVIGYTCEGFGGMSRLLYDWEFDFLCPQEKIHQPRPVIYNSWYPYEFDVNEENCVAMVKKAAAVGAELFVLDDGWMPGRTNDRTGLGDWLPDPVRFPRGLRPVADACHENGILFGLWVEPEMANPDSALYRAHPDWVLRDEGRPMAEMRRQLVLNMALDEVRDWCIAFLDRLLSEYALDYLKWDMNRYVSERGDNRETPVRYIQNVYAIWAFMNEKYPQVLFENCASGGGRADFGMLPYADRMNRSDNADPVDGLRIHEGFSTLFLPKLAGGAGNVSPSPNGINGRALPLDYRIAVGMNGSMSVGVNPLKCGEGELNELRTAVERFKRYRDDLHESYVLRLRSVYDGNVSALEYLRRDGKAVALMAFGHGLRYREGFLRLRLRGLDENALYRDEQGRAFSGGALMHKGIDVRLEGDYAHSFWFFVKEER